MLKPTEKEIEDFLEWSKKPCMCESYYSYQCTKHRDVADGFLNDQKEVLNHCLREGLVEWDSYHTLNVVVKQNGR